jgi:hypothetical protein
VQKRYNELARRTIVVFPAAMSVAAFPMDICRHRANVRLHAVRGGALQSYAYYSWLPEIGLNLAP